MFWCKCMCGFLCARIPSRMCIFLLQTTSILTECICMSFVSCSWEQSQFSDAPFPLLLRVPSIDKHYISCINLENCSSCHHKSLHKHFQQQQKIKMPSRLSTVEWICRLIRWPCFTRGVWDYTTHHQLTSSCLLVTWYYSITFSSNQESPILNHNYRKLFLWTYWIGNGLDFILKLH